MTGTQLPARTSFPLRPISRSRNIPTLRYEKKQWETRRKKSPSHKLAVISETNFTNQPPRELSKFFWRMLKRDAENAEVKECVISQFHEVGGPDTWIPLKMTAVSSERGEASRRVIIDDTYEGRMWSRLMCTYTYAHRFFTYTYLYMSAIKDLNLKDRLYTERTILLKFQKI